MRAVDVDVHRREAILKTLRDEALGCQVITLGELMAADDAEYTGVVLETSGMKMNLIQQVQDASKTPLGVFERDPPHDAVDLVAQRQQVVRQIAAILPGDAGN